MLGTVWEAWNHPFPVCATFGFMGVPFIRGVVMRVLGWYGAKECIGIRTFAKLVNKYFTGMSRKVVIG
jgi:hypothetical protein